MTSNRAALAAAARLAKSAFVALTGLALTGASALTTPAHAGDVPTFAVDAAWPKPLPNNWILGQVGGITVDAQGHVWVIHRPRSLTDDEKGATLNPPRSKCCVPAPPVLEFDADGNLLRSWGGAGEGYEWVGREHGIEVDERGFVWVGGNADNDNAILKFTLDGKFVMQIGKIAPSKGSIRRSSASPPKPRSTRTPMKYMSRTATAIAASSCSTPRPAPTSGTGAPTAIRRTTTSSRPTIPRRPPRSNLPIPSIA
jgi:hypothetical protein